MNDQSDAPQKTEDANGKPSYPALEIDYALYEQMLEGSEWDADQKREFIETMWSIVVAFVDLGLDIHPVQQVLGDVDETENVQRAVNEHVIDSQNTSTDAFEDAVGGKTPSLPEREAS